MAKGLPPRSEVQHPEKHQIVVMLQIKRKRYELIRHDKNSMRPMLSWIGRALVQLKQEISSAVLLGEIKA